MASGKSGKSGLKLTRQVNADGVKEKTHVEIPPEEIIIVEGANPRIFGAQDEDLDSLMEDIILHGQTGDVTVVLDGKGRPECRGMGGRRVRAILAINEAKLIDPPLMVRCQVAKMDDRTAFLRAFSENEERKSPSIADQAAAVRRMIDEYGMSQAEVLEKVFHNRRSAPWVSQLVTISGLPITLLRRVHAGEIGFQAAYELSQMDKDDRKWILEDISACGEKITPEAIRRRMKDKADATGESPVGAGSPETVEIGTEGQPHAEVEEETEEAPESAEPPKKKRGRPSKASKGETTSRSIKDVRAFFTSQAAVAEGEDADVWQELAGYFLDWIDGKFGDRKMATCARTACGLK